MFTLCFPFKMYGIYFEKACSVEEERSHLADLVEQTTPHLPFEVREVFIQ